MQHVFPAQQGNDLILSLDEDVFTTRRKEMREPIKCPVGSRGEPG